MKFLYALPLISLTASAIEYQAFEMSKRQDGLFKRQNGCSGTTPAICGAGCMPNGATCCNSQGAYCTVGLECDNGGCCPTGETCTGPGGTSIVGGGSTPAAGGNGGSIPSATPTLGGGIPSATPTSGGCSGTANPEVCGARCMPIGATCCNSQGYYCDVGFDCAPGGICCPIGQTCTGPSGKNGAEHMVPSYDVVAYGLALGGIGYLIF